MPQYSYQQLFDRGDRRDQKRTEWYRHILLVASGSFSVLVSFTAGRSWSAMQAALLSAAWTLIAVGIVAAGVALYAEVWKEKRMVELMYEAMQSGSESSVSADPPFLLKHSGTLAHWTLALGVLTLAAFAVLAVLQPPISDAASTPMKTPNAMLSTLVPMANKQAP